MGKELSAERLDSMIEREQNFRNSAGTPWGFTRHQENLTALTELTSLRAKLEKAKEALTEIRELNMAGADENGHRWANSDLIDQSCVFALAELDKPE